jgi:hypothetical protein
MEPTIKSDTSDSPAEESRTASDVQSETSQAPLGAEQAESKQDDKAEQSLQDAVKDALKDRSTKDSSSEEDKKDEEELDSNSESNEESKDKESKDEKVDDKKEDVVDETKEKEPEKGPIPYERFHEEVQQRQQKEQLLEKVRPMVENYQAINTFCQQNAISPDRFQAMLKFEALRTVDPVAALREIEPIYNELKGHTGDRLPVDLQTDVDAGDITLERAKELSRLRAQSQLGEKRVLSSQQAMAKQQNDLLQRQLVDSFQSWEQAKRGTDPDYKPKVKESEPDGKWELAKHLFTGYLNATDGEGTHLHKINSPADMIALQERAYSEASRFMKVQRPPTTRRLSSSGSSSVNGKTKSIEDAGSLREAVQIGMRQSGRR